MAKESQAANAVIWSSCNPQPAQRDFGIEWISRARELVAVRSTLRIETPFCSLREFSCEDAATGTPSVLLVAPLSGHFAFVLREMVLGLLPDFRVFVTDWINAAYIPPEHGPFDFDGNIATIRHMIEALGPDAAVIATCQSVVPTLAAVSLISAGSAEQAPRALVLMAGPVDPLAHPTRIVQLLREHPLDWFENAFVDRVPPGLPGALRRIYPAETQLSALRLYWGRHLVEGRELFAKTFADDGADPIHFPFTELFTSIMDLPAEYFLGNIRAVFQDCALSTGRLRWRGLDVDPRAVRRMALMTIEGEHDDIAAPGQTVAAHTLCTNIAANSRSHLLIERSGHFSLFHGARWREAVLPSLRDFLERERPRAKLISISEVARRL